MSYLKCTMANSIKWFSSLIKLISIQSMFGRLYNYMVIFASSFTIHT